MPFDVTVRVKAPSGVTSAEAAQYVRDAVRCHGGGLRVTDPGFSLGKRCSVVRVTGAPGVPKGMKFHTNARGETYLVPKRARHER